MLVFGLVHTRWKPIPGQFKDYIAMPETQPLPVSSYYGYRRRREPFEIQIRTVEMHKVAEYGIAAHWKYKEGKRGNVEDKEEVKLAWLRQTLEWQKDPERFKGIYGDPQSGLVLQSGLRIHTKGRCNGTSGRIHAPRLRL